MIDSKLLDYATERQAECLKALEAHGTHEEAAAALGIRRDSYTKTISRLRKTAASKGYAPGHWEDGVAPGYRMGKVTIQRGPKGVERVWERQSPEVTDVAALVREAVEAIRAETPREPISTAPKAPLADLLTEYTFTDYHLGMRAWDEEGGAAWSIEIAEDLLKKAIDFAASKAPASRKGLLAQLGDFLHFDLEAYCRCGRAYYSSLPCRRPLHALCSR